MNKYSFNHKLPSVRNIYGSEINSSESTIFSTNKKTNEKNNSEIKNDVRHIITNVINEQKP